MSITTRLGIKLRARSMRVVAVGYRLDGETAGLQHVAEQLTVEIVVLDNEDSLRHCAPDASAPTEAFATIISLTDG